MAVTAKYRVVYKVVGPTRRKRAEKCAFCVCFTARVIWKTRHDNRKGRSKRSTVLQSAAKDVTAYLQEVPAERQECLTKLREICLTTLAGYEESMVYGMPCYAKDGVVEVAFASQKNYISLYALKQDAVEANKDALAGLNVGKGCIRYSKPAKMDFSVIEKLLSDTFDSPASAC